MNFNRRVLPMAPYRCTILSLQLLPCWNRTFDYFLFMCTHMIAKLFSEPCQHKSCIHKPKQDPCFCSSLCSVTHQRRLCIANRTNLWGSFAALLLSLCLAQCPPPPHPRAPTPTFTLYDLLSRILLMCVTAGQESREAVCSLRSLFCVWTASNSSIPCTQTLPPPNLPTSTILADLRAHMQSTHWHGCCSDVLR